MIPHLMLAAAFAATVTVLASPGHAQTDLTTAKQAVRECVAQVRREASQPENFALGAPPMWRNFDAYISPDGRVHYNTQFAGEQDGAYRFEKCLADRGFGLGSTAPANSPKPPDTCTQEEIDSHPGDCWIKLTVWEKQLTFNAGFLYGWLQAYMLAEAQQYGRIGRSLTQFPSSSDMWAKAVPYLDQLYGVQQNRTIRWDDAFDLLLRTQSNPQTKDIPGLIALYRNHERLLFSGYLRKFVPPNKVVISEYSDRFVPKWSSNRSATLTLFGIAAVDDNANAVREFMAALLNVKQCNTLIRETELYKSLIYLKTDKQKQEEKELEERMFSPELRVVVQYPSYGQEEFFNASNEWSGIVLLNKNESVCTDKEALPRISQVRVGQLMLEGAKDQNVYGPEHFDRSALGDFINLNQP